MSNSCNNFKNRVTKISELASYSNLKSNDIIYILENKNSNLYSRKTTFSDFVQSITRLTSSLSGNVFGIFKGNLTGSVIGNLIGNTTGSFSGTITNTIGSLKGVPFKTLNQKQISFDGTSLYSVSSSYSPLTDYSNTTLNSNYTLTSSYASEIYSLFAKSGSYALTSSLSITSSISQTSFNANFSNKSEFAEYSLNGKRSESSSYSIKSNFALSSSYVSASSFSNTSSYSFRSITSSFSDISNYLKYPKSNFGMVYLTTFNDNSTDIFTTDTLIVNGSSDGTTDLGWKKAELTGAFSPTCGLLDDGKLPSDVKYICVKTIVSVKDRQYGWLAWCADINDVLQPKIILDYLYCDLKDSGTLKNLYVIKQMILPIKPGTSPYFYYRAINLISYKIFIEGYIPTKISKCL